MFLPFRKFINLIFTFSAVISGWSFLVLLSNSNYNEAIKEVISKMYLNQKEFLFNVKDLSLLLVKDANSRFKSNNKGEYEFNNILNKKSEDSSYNYLGKSLENIIKTNS